jgi:hypothetical protein
MSALYRYGLWGYTKSLIAPECALGSLDEGDDICPCFVQKMNNLCRMRDFPLESAHFGYNEPAGLDESEHVDSRTCFKPQASLTAQQQRDWPGPAKIGNDSAKIPPSTQKKEKQTWRKKRVSRPCAGSTQSWARCT